MQNVAPTFEFEVGNSNDSRFICDPGSLNMCDEQVKSTRRSMGARTITTSTLDYIDTQVFGPDLIGLSMIVFFKPAYAHFKFRVRTN